MNHFSQWRCLMLAGIIFLPSSVYAFQTDKEWEESTPFYEDDAWYDVSEWMDGNDYNPADETFGTWNDEVYDSDTGAYDYDDDTSFGYTANTTDDDWFYDYWEPDYTYWDSYAPDYNAMHSYYDRDGNGVYDAYTSYYDWDDDGQYEDIDYYSFASSKTKETSDSEARKSGADRKNADKSPMQAKRMEVTGDVKATKTVTVRGKKHTIAQLKPQGDGEAVAIDLGPTSRLRGMSIREGSKMTAKGPATKVGDKQVLLASEVTINGNPQKLDRQPREFKGTIVDSHKSKVRGKEHTFVVLKTTKDKQRLVDLGPTSALKDVELKKNEEISVRGVPFQIKDRPVVMAHSADVSGKQLTIRRANKPSSTSS